MHRLPSLNTPEIIFINATFQFPEAPVISTSRRSQIPKLNELFEYAFLIGSGITAYRFVGQYDM